MSRTVKLGTWAAAVCACIALCGIVARPAISAFEIRYATHDAVDSKITLAMSTVTHRIDGHHMSRIEDSIRELEIRIAVGEATRADRAQLEYYKRQREEMLKK